mmetsp:Transcript_82450/g.176634  ORF Transcript_82450/g.176634 Transcript_82450/m.176634 type:complete len:356 (-) Transcript_82450:83-1150(-)
MVPAPMRNALPGLVDAQSAATKTIFFVDVDGVLNIGVKDGGKSPLGFSDKNIEHALEMYQGRPHVVGQHVHQQDIASMEFLVAVHSRRVGHDEDTTYGDFASDSSWGCCETFCRRLALLIQAAGPNRHVVLSSTWRKPQHRKLVEKLEWVIARCLGEDFSFDGRTSMQTSDRDRTPTGRVQIIGDYLETYGTQMDPTCNLQVVVLEDFHITSLDGSWSCADQQRADSCKVVESYLRGRTTIPCEVKLLHTYDSWISDEGRKIEIGSGLTMRHFKEASNFLGINFGELRQMASAAAPTRVNASEDEAPYVPTTVSTPVLKVRTRMGHGFMGHKASTWFSLSLPDFLQPSVRAGRVV